MWSDLRLARFSDQGIPHFFVIVTPTMPRPGTLSPGRVMNKLYYGDNLDILPGLADGSVDLVYLDPPFNSNRSYNVIFAQHAGTDAAAQIEAFDDTWHWTPVTDGQYQRYALSGELPARVADALTAFRVLLGENDAMAYLVNMAPGWCSFTGCSSPPGRCTCTATPR